METATTARASFFKNMRGKERVPEKGMSFWDHLEDLRWHILRSIMVALVASTVILINIDAVYDRFILAPARDNFYTYSALCRLSHFLHLGNALCMKSVKIQMQVNTVNGTFTSALDIAVIGGFICAFPYICWELWRFISPALSSKQRKSGTMGIFWVSVCFLIGGMFGYYLMAPFTFNFLSTYTLGKTDMVIYRPSINDYIDTLTNLILGCGLAFELPVLTYVLAKVGIITGTFLKTYSKIAVVLIVAIAGIITPSPDWISQLIVSLPLFILYGISVILASRIEKQRAA